jgi:hypothetical protein
MMESADWPVLWSLVKIAQVSILTLTQSASTKSLEVHSNKLIFLLLMESYNHLVVVIDYSNLWITFKWK